jgi:type I restriction-modification system DNA methylase subunit/predicted type IV restriction endonuclease
MVIRPLHAGVGGLAIIKEYGYFLSMPQSAPQSILDLVNRFSDNKESYKSPTFNEAQLRIDFLNPFFEALGWDIANKQGFAEAYKEVVHEDAVKVGTETKAPDYSFRIGGQRKFFVEAKKPFINIKEDIDPAFQVRRYDWSAKLPLSILTDFEEFSVYDCRVKPVKTDKASVCRLLYIRYDEYESRWAEIAGIFSKDAINKGSFDKFAADSKRGHGTTEVDDAFLSEIEGWRDLLARNVAIRNEKLSNRELNFAVQRTIDRLIFLRICEDRGIEDYGRLQAHLNGENIYKRLCVLFREADDKYNSGLFHFREEKARQETPDDITLKLDIDDKVLKEIIENLYYPDCAYEFSVLPADILGQVYEQFLGKVIRLTEGHQAKVEDKPEVKKAGGVFYTPTYIVDYIVKNTVGKLLNGDDLTPGPSPARRGGMTPKEVAKLKILDPACGSGSFLIGAYQYLLDWHRDWYCKNGAEKWQIGKNPTLYKARAGECRLTTPERKRILLNNIYGVDIDTQAVEVTKLSLLLKVLEGENDQSIAQQLKLFHQRALPDLGNNIKCGNSLIEHDYYNSGGVQETLALWDRDDDEIDEEQWKVNAFDWESKEGFQEIMGSGGFDVVMGNPPYGATLSDAESDYLRKKFHATTKDLDTYMLFMEMAILKSKSGGRVSMIVPTGWHSGMKFSALRRFVACQTDPVLFVNLPYDVFKAWVDTTVFTVVKRENPTSWPRKDKRIVSIITFPKRHRIDSIEEFEEHITKADFSAWFADGGDEYLSYSDVASTVIIRKIAAVGQPLGNMADVQRGVTPFKLTEKPTHATSKFAFNGTVRRYLFDKGEKCFIRFDATLAEPKPERYFLGPRLLLRELISRQFQLQAVKVSDDFITNKSMQSILSLPMGPDLSYLLGILNSRLMSWYFLKHSNIAQRDDFPKIVLKETRSLPIRPIDFSKSKDKSRHDHLVKLVNSMLSLHQKLPLVRTEHEKTVLSRQIVGTDRQIDSLVYELYGLTAEEIKIVESA